MRYQTLLALILSCATLPAGCSSILGQDCISLAPGPAIVAHITNAPTGMSPTSGVTLIVSGTMYDSVTTMTVGGALQGGNRPGTYNVTIRQPGYREFSQRGIKVESASCSQPMTVSLTVVLQPL